MAKLFDAIGHIYGRLTVIESLGVVRRKQIVLTKCDCGNTFTTALSNIRSGNTLSCGCLRKETTSQRRLVHGYRQTRLYRVHSAMLQRCNNPNNRSYPDYGQRGIVVCPEWYAFSGFLEWALATNYSDELEIDRIDVNMPYTPDNCRWVPEITQARNRRTRLHSSKFTGVHLVAKTGKWEASITVNKKKIYLGKFDSENTAWESRCKFIDENSLNNFQDNR